MDRRHLLKLSAAATAAAFVPTRLWAQEAAVGAMRLQTLSDGELSLPPGFIFDAMPEGALAEVLAEQGISRDAPLTPPCNVTLLRDEEKVVLFDAGSGPTFQDGVGYLIDALDELGVDPGDVTHVVFTHGHPDHLWGVLDDFDEPLFYNAEHLMGRAEWEYWRDPETVNVIGEARAAFAAGAKRRLEIIGDAMVLFDNGEEILPGVAARATYGHTPGHMAFEVRSGSESALIIGDAIGNPHVAFAKPDWPSGSDQDRDQAAETRIKLLDQLAAEQTPLIGYHLPHGGLGRAERKDGAYRFVPTDA